jgi:uncharacterized protein (TIGR02466 family)
MINFEILPIFPSVIAAIKIDENIEYFWNSVKKLEYCKSNSDDSYLMHVSKDMRILDSDDILKNIIINYFYKFKNNILKLETTEFDITTSWVTKTDPEGYCQYHCHRNSYYSGVLYNKKTNKPDSGDLMFNDFGIKQDTIMINEPVEWNILNSNKISVEPDDNLLIFFPSRLYHKINKYTGLEPRYSLAFNIFPLGKIGNGDSTVDFNLMK